MSEPRRAGKPRPGSGRADAVLREARYGLRRLLGSPVMAVGIIVTLALGIGANTAIFTLLDSVVYRHLPVPNPGQLHALGHGSVMGLIVSDDPTDRLEVLFSYPMFQSLERQNRAFSQLSAISSYPINAFLTPETGSHPERARAFLVSGNFFSMLGVSARIGRLIATADDREFGGHPGVVLSHGLWTRRFGGRDDVVGSQIHLNGLEYTVLGVTPPGFTGVTGGLDTEVWVPLTMQAELERGPSFLEDRDSMWLRLVGRLRPGVTAAAATTQVNDLYRRLVRAEVGDEISPQVEQEIGKIGTEIVPVARGFSVLRSRYQQPLFVLMVVVALVLLVACINIGTLLLARAQAAQRDVALRMALGSSRRRVLLGFLLESAMLSVAGGAMALVVARWTVGFLVSLVSTRGPAPLETAIDARVLFFTFGVSLLTALTFGLAPAFTATGTSLTALLGSRTVAGDAPRRRWGVRQVLVTLQVAVSLLLLVCAGLFSRSLHNLMAQDMGFRTEGVLTVNIDPQGGGFAEDELPGLFRDLQERVQGLPEVESASLSLFGLLGRSRWVSRAWVEGCEDLEESETTVELSTVTPGYFTTIGAPVLMGRPFSDRDQEDAPKVAVVTQAFARQFFGKDSPLGRRLGLDGPESSREIEIVGVVQDLKHRDLRSDAPRLAFFPVAQKMEHLKALQVRTRNDPSAAASRVRQAILEVAPSLPILSIHPVAADLERSLRQERLLSRLTSLFGLLALLLASIGLFGILLYRVTRRTHEIGIRMALGARRSRVLAMVLHGALASVGVGVVVGIGGSLLVGRLLRSLLFGVAPGDPATIASAVVTLVVVAAAAALWPAWRAARLDPAKALRTD